MDALELLRSDHDKVNALFQQFERGGNSQDFKQLFTDLDRELTIHTQIEEKIFYPAVKNHPETQDLVQEAYHEHGEAKLLLTDIAALDNTSAEWGQKMTQLMRAIQQHVSEEEGELFPRVRQLMSEQQLEQLGQQLMQAKQSATGPATQLGQENMMLDPTGTQMGSQDMLR